MRRTSTSNSAGLVKRLTRKWEQSLDRSLPKDEIARYMPSADGATPSITFASDAGFMAARSIMGPWAIAARQFPGVTLVLNRARGKSRVTTFAWLDEVLNAIQLDFGLGDRPLDYAEATEAFGGWVCELPSDEIHAQVNRLGQRREVAISELDRVRRINDDYLQQEPDADHSTLGPGLDHRRAMIEADLRNIDFMLAIYREAKEQLGIS